jgi:hypothetical protein
VRHNTFGLRIVAADRDVVRRQGDDFAINFVTAVVIWRYCDTITWLAAVGISRIFFRERRIVEMVENCGMRRPAENDWPES